MTAGRRASETRKNPFAAGFAAPTKPVPSDEPVVVPDEGGGAVAVDAAPAAKLPMSKYTALLDGETAAAFDELALAARRKLGRKVDKSQLVRALIMLAADDVSLRDQVIDQIGAGDAPR